MISLCRDWSVIKAGQFQYSLTAATHPNQTLAKRPFLTLVTSRLEKHQRSIPVCFCGLVAQFSRQRTQRRMPPRHSVPSKVRSLRIARSRNSCRRALGSIRSSRNSLESSHDCPTWTGTSAPPSRRRAETTDETTVWPKTRLTSIGRTPAVRQMSPPVA